MLIVQIPLLVALVTGDLISGEAAMGTIRMLLTKPISRTKVLLSKYAAGLIYTFFILLWMGFLAVIVGRWLFGDGDLMVLNSDGLVIIQANDIAWRFLGGFMIAFLALATVATLSIMLSCFSDNSIGPIVSTMSVIILFTIIGTLDVPVFDNVRPNLFTTHMAAWRSFFDNPLPIQAIKESVVILFAHIGIFLSIAIYHFNKKDILS
jgi:ABC-2 type transport system permease protein